MFTLLIQTFPLKLFFVFLFNIFLTTLVHNFCSQLLFKDLVNTSLFTTFVHWNSSLLLFTTFVQNFCSQLLFKTFVHNFCLQFLFTTLVKKFAHNLFSQFFFQTPCSQLLFITFFHNFSFTIYAQNFCLGEASYFKNGKIGDNVPNRGGLDFSKMSDV